MKNLANSGKNFDSGYWQNKYIDKKTGWDIGYVATPIKEYVDQLQDKSIKILVPGAGNAYEVEYLYKKGFKKTWLLDFAPQSINNFKQRVKIFPKEQIINEDFFNHTQKYDLIIELTFFSSLNPNSRENYVSKMSDLLNPGGKLIGLLFNHGFGNNFPPFGGTDKEYQKLFKNKFIIKKMEIAYNSIKPRANRELFIILEKLNKV
ncbi:MAG: SAM-dependent methyltransferase [Bacteroidetes bacterium 4572_117]|nr:MAG: SAM-dependent methyltransferase [Bacteroidetes bacterium 4572_117]